MPALWKGLGDCDRLLGTLYHALQLGTSAAVPFCCPFAIFFSFRAAASPDGESRYSQAPTKWPCTSDHFLQRAPWQLGLSMAA
jgi:hypothetical protein